MPAVVETIPPQIHELSSDDGSVVLRSAHSPGYTTILETWEQWPDDMSLEKAVEHLAADPLPGADSPLLIGAPPERQVWLSIVTPRSAGEQLVNRFPYQGILDGLGYAFKRDIAVDGGQRIAYSRYMYPSTERLNDFMVTVFGDEGVTFQGYPGNRHTAEEFIEVFTREGKIIIADTQPYQAHDVSDHVMGWVGIPPALTLPLREGLTGHLDKLNTVSNSDSPNLVSRLMIKAAMQTCEELTPKLMRLVGQSKDLNASLRKEAALQIVDLAELFLAPELTYFPLAVRGKSVSALSDSGVPEDIAEIILNRYEQADEAGCEMAAA